MQALKVDYRNYSAYRNLAILLGEEPLDKQFMSQKFAVLMTDPQKLEIYDETDFRTFFKWVTTGDQDEFKEIELLPLDEDGEREKWRPSPNDDLGAV